MIDDTYIAPIELLLDYWIKNMYILHSRFFSTQKAKTRNAPVFTAF